jgi:IS1 family transposase
MEDKYKVGIFATDKYDVYGKYRIADRHIITKAETALVESKNSSIGHYFARFNRKTKRYSKNPSSGLKECYNIELTGGLEVCYRRF